MSTQEIKEAITIIKGTTDEVPREIQVLLDLAQSVIDAKILEKRGKEGIYGTCLYDHGWNDAIDACQAIIAKKNLKIKELEEEVGTEHSLGFQEGYEKRGNELPSEDEIASILYYECLRHGNPEYFMQWEDESDENKKWYLDKAKAISDRLGKG